MNNYEDKYLNAIDRLDAEQAAHNQTRNELRDAENRIARLQSQVQQEREKLKGRNLAYLLTCADVMDELGINPTSYLQIEKVKEVLKKVKV
jgi:hypothetical protein